MLSLKETILHLSGSARGDVLLNGLRNGVGMDASSLAADILAQGRKSKG